MLLIRLRQQNNVSVNAGLFFQALVNTEIMKHIKTLISIGGMSAQHVAGYIRPIKTKHIRS